MAKKAEQTVRVTEEVWYALRNQKAPGDTFNDVIRRNLEELEKIDPTDEAPQDIESTVDV